MKPSNHNCAENATGTVRHPVERVAAGTSAGMELMKLIQRSNQGHCKQDAACELPSLPAKRPPQQPGEKKSSNGKVEKVDQLVRRRKRREVNVLTGER